jgi:ABC-2 type transport system ATP-binding protein
MIRAVGLGKTYGPIKAATEIDLEVFAGQFFGLLGPNGAGKSTTVGMLTTRITPTQGSARIAGLDVVADSVAVKRHIGVVSQGNTLDRRLTMRENLEFRGRYFGMGRRAARHRAGDLLATFGLARRGDAMANELSGGQVRRVLIARALMHTPAVLFLDEPTAGVDPQTRANLWDLLRAMHREGLTVLLTTHYLEEAEALCEKVAIIDHGRMLACDYLPALTRASACDTVYTLTYAPAAEDALAALAQLALALDGVSRTEIKTSELRVFARDEESLLGALIAAGVRIGLVLRDVYVRRPSLETIFLRLTGREYRE